MSSTEGVGLALATGEARIEQSRWQVARCKSAFEAWLRRRQEADRSGQYASQLGALKLVVDENLGLMAHRLDSIAADSPSGEIYTRCKQVDRQLVWVRRLWDYFREKWDQRDDDERGRMLAAADEIVWSAYAPPFRRLDRPVGPAPLPYVGAEFGPHAIPRRRPPQRLVPSDVLLRKTLAKLPVPVIGLPEICVSDPWWLILLAHEVGHQVAYDLDGGRLPATVAACLGDAASRAHRDGLPEGDWAGWAHELFADAFAAATVGAAHLWAIAELERGSDETLLRGGSAYPPPIVRHAVAAHTLASLGLDGVEALPPVPPAVAVDELRIEGPERERVGRMLELAPAIALALLDEPLVDAARLRDLAPPDPSRLARSGKAGRWGRELAGEAEVRPEPTLEAPRLATVGGLAEWANAMEEPDGERRRERAGRLRERMLDLLPDCREPGVRAGEEDRHSVVVLAREVAQEAMAVTAAEEDWVPAETAPLDTDVPVV